MQRNYRRALRGALLASVSILGAGLSQAFSAVTDYPDGSTNSSPIVLTDNTRQLQVLTGSAIQSGVISESGGSFGFEKIGNGTLILTGANTYTGGTTIGAGTLALSGVGKFGAGVINDNAALQILTTEALSNAIVFGASSDSRISAAAGTVLSLTGDLTFNTVAGRTLYFGSSTDTGTIAVASGNVTIGANAGALEIAGGTLKDISTTVPQSNFATALGKFSSVTIDSGATLEIDSNGNGRASNTETFIKLFGGGQLVMGGNSLPRVVLGSSNFSGKISGAGYVGIGPLDASLPHDTIVLTGNGNNAVEFQIGTGSTLQVGDGGTTGSLANGGRVVGYTDSRYGSAVLKYARSDNVTLGRFLLGSLVLQQAGDVTPESALALR